MNILNILIRAAFVLALLSGGSTLLAQKTQVVLYKDQLAAKFDTVNCVKNVIKINPLLFLNGEVPLYYERALSPKLSIELAVGVTLRNYVTLNFGENVDDFGAGTEVIPNLSLHAAGRYYITHDLEPYGWYVGPVYAHRTYTKNIRHKDDEGRLTDDKSLDSRIFDELRVILGFQSISSSSNWLIDIYGGLGARNRNLDVVSETNNFGSWTYETEKVQDIVPAFYIGFKLGVGF